MSRSSDVILTTRQVKSLKGCIARSADASDFTKRLIIWLIDRSNNLSKPSVVVVSTHWDDTPAERIDTDIQNMVSPDRSTHLHELFTLTGSWYFISRDYDRIVGCRVWLAPRLHGKKVPDLQRLNYDLEAIQAIDLEQLRKK